MSKDMKKLEDLARLAGVSIATVSRALGGSNAVNAVTKRKIWQLALANNYPFRRYTPSGPLGAEATIAIVIPQPQAREPKLSDPFVLELVAAIGEAARERGCDLIISHVSPSGHDDLVEVMETNRADGVIFLGQSTLHEEFNELAASQRKFVVWGAELPGQTYCSVGSDNFVGGRRAARHLIRLGRKRIVFLGDPIAPEVMQRHQGYVEALKESRIPIDEKLVLATHFDIESGEASIDELLGEGIDFDGIVAASDMIALGAMRALARKGIAVPKQVSVVGYDNVQFSRFARPALTTISQNVEKAGKILVSKLLSASGSSDIPSERVPTDLIVRDSCGG
ncbi:MAG: LacI family transcription regulator [Hyphomonadaceae bacterium]|nr:MAG: LacI family transcription regulator [Hyphomonadaceae bacterium]